MKHIAKVTSNGVAYDKVPDEVAAKAEYYWILGRK